MKRVNEIAVVTGGNRGIGLAITNMLIDEGFSVLVIHNDRNRSVMSQPQVIEMICDVTNVSGLSFSFAHAAITKWSEKAMTLLVNNAGIAGAKHFVDLEPRDYLEMFNTNLVGAANASKIFVERCLKGSPSNIASRIINIASVSGLQGFSGGAHYCASKFALIGLTQVMAKELSKIGIAVNAVCPSPTQTDMWTKLDADYRREGFMPAERNEDDYMNKLLIKRMGTPEDVAESVRYLIRSSYTTGIALPVCGGNILR